MSSIAVQGGATGTGVISLLAPVTNTNRTINLPDSNGTIVTSATAGVPINGPAFSAYNTTSPSVTGATFTKVVFDTELFDTNNCFASSTFTPTVAGYYQINANLTIVSTTTTDFVYVMVYKNGVAITRGSHEMPAAANYPTSVVSSLAYLNGSTDYLEVYCYISATRNIQGGSSLTSFSAAMVRSAV